MRHNVLAALIAAGIWSAMAIAAPPAFRSDTCPVKVDGQRLDTVLTPAGAALRNTFAYERSKRLWHFWGFLADDANFPSAASSLRAVVHATSSDGLHFISDSNLTYAFGSADYHTFGADIDPPLDFLRAVYDTSSGTWKLFNWTENDSVASPSFGQYNYNTSVDDIGTIAGTTAVVHQGPLLSPYAGNHVGTFGFVDGNVYLRIDGGAQDGGLGRLPYTDGIPATAGAYTSEADLFAGTPYCWFLDPACGSSDPRLPSYVHNVGRTLRQTDSAATLATFYTFRDSSTYARQDKQIWYVESADGGATWSMPQGVFADGSAITIDGQPLDSVAGSANFSGVDVVEDANVCRAYFSTQDANGTYVTVSATTGGACDVLFADEFEGCGD